MSGIEVLLYVIDCLCLSFSRKLCTNLAAVAPGAHMQRTVGSVPLSPGAHEPVPSC